MLKKGLIVGVLNLLFGLGVNFMVGMVWLAINQKYQNLAIFRLWVNPLTATYFAYPFILGSALIYLWNLVQKQLEREPLNREIKLSKRYIIVATIITSGPRRYSFIM